MKYIFLALLTIGILSATPAVQASENEQAAPVEVLQPTTVLPLKPGATRVLLDLQNTCKNEARIWDRGVLQAIVNDAQNVEASRDAHTNKIFRIFRKRQRELDRLEPRFESPTEYREAQQELLSSFNERRKAIFEIHQPKLQKFAQELMDNLPSPEQLARMRAEEQTRQAILGLRRSEANYVKRERLL